MTKPSFTVPRPLADLLAILPAHPRVFLFTLALNRFLAGELPQDLRQALQDKKIRVHVTDARLVFDFEYAGGKFVACRRSSAMDLCFSATAYDFWLLIQRKEDPDTLFFSRRLLVEGNTELGLLVKNTLDAIELPWSKLQSFLKLGVARKTIAAGRNMN